MSALPSITMKIMGVDPILLNNPRTVNPADAFAKASSEITGKKKKTEEDLLRLKKLDIESKLYMREDGTVWIPSTWVIAALGGVSFKQAKIARKDIRAAVFPSKKQLPLKFAGQEKVKAPGDISGNPDFHIPMLLKQGQVKICKYFPIFKNWSFETTIEYDPTILDRHTLVQLMEYACNYGGFGDFRPTFGRAHLEIVED